MTRKYLETDERNEAGQYRTGVSGNPSGTSEARRAGEQVKRKKKAVKISSIWHCWKESLALPILLSALDLKLPEQFLSPGTRANLHKGIEDPEVIDFKEINRIRIQMFQIAIDFIKKTCLPELQKENARFGFIKKGKNIIPLFQDNRTMVDKVREATKALNDPVRRKQIEALKSKLQTEPERTLVRRKMKREEKKESEENTKGKGTADGTWPLDDEE